MKHLLLFWFSGHQNLHICTTYAKWMMHPSVVVKPVVYTPEIEEEKEELEVGKLKAPLHNVFGKLHLDETHYQFCNINEKLLSAIISITNNQVSKICSQLDGHVFQFHYGSKKHIKTIAAFCTSFVAEILSANGFSWDDLVILRFYYPTRLLLSTNAMDAVFSEAFLDLKQVDESVKVGKQPLFNLVPVIGSGQLASADDLITCKLVASKFASSKL